MTDDFDVELLGLVGSDDEGDDVDHTQVVEDRSSSPASQEAQQSVEKVAEEPASNRRGVAQKVKARGRKRRKPDSDEEDGEASPSEPSSPSAALKSESEDGVVAPTAADQDAPLFPLEGRFHDAADRKHILALPEIEREEILADRAQQVTRRLQDVQLKLLQARTTSAATSKNKRKAASADLEESDRRTTRPKSDKRSALDNYKRAREEKDAARNRVDTVRDRKDERTPSSTSERDAEGESEVEWAEPASESRRDEAKAELRDFNNCRIGRSMFSKVCFYPEFETSIKNCFARVSVGINQETGQMDYRMCQIKGVVQGKPYKMENAANHKFFLTDQHLLVAQGPHEKPYPMNGTSDSKFTEAELERYTNTLRKEGLRLPPRSVLVNRNESIHTLFNTRFTEETLQQKLTKQRQMQSKYDPALVTKAKRSAIYKRRDEAERKDNFDEMDKCDAELQALNDSTVINSKLDTSGPRPDRSEYDRLDKMNRKIHQQNIIDTRNALIREKKARQAESQALWEKKQAEKRAAEEAEAKAKAAAEKRKLKQEALAASKGVDDLFGESPAASRAVTPMSALAAMSRPGTPKVGGNGNNNKPKGPLGALKKKTKFTDNIIAEMDLDIDVEI